MDKIIQPTNPVVGAAYGQQALLDLPIGPRYHSVTLEIIATAAVGNTLTLADVMGLINVKVNGRTQRSHEAANLDKIVARYHNDFASKAYDYTGGKINWTGTPLIPKAPLAGANPGGSLTVFYLTLWFAEPWRKSYAATEAMAWYTSWADGSTLRSLQIELNIPSASANVLANSAITVNAYTETDNAVGPLDANKQPVALITRFERNFFPYAGAGDLYITALPKRDIYTQLSVFSPSEGNNHDMVTAIQIKVDDRIVRNVSRIRNDVLLVGREWNQAQLDQDMFDVGFDASDLPTDGLVMQAGNLAVKNFVVIPTVGSAVCNNKSLEFIAQVYGPLV